MVNPKRGEIGYIKSYKGTYSILRANSVYEDIFVDRHWDQDMSPRYFSARVVTFKGQLYKYIAEGRNCLLYTSPSPRDRQKSRMPSSA